MYASETAPISQCGPSAGYDKSCYGVFHILAVLDHKKAEVATNVWLSILHNRTLIMGWLLAPRSASDVPINAAWIPEIHAS